MNGSGRYGNERKILFRERNGREGFLGKNSGKRGMITGLQGPGAGYPVSPCRVSGPGRGRRGPGTGGFGRIWGRCARKPGASEDGVDHGFWHGTVNGPCLA